MNTVMSMTVFMKTKTESLSDEYNVIFHKK